ncbi:MAG: nucleotide sugar dehydrogenase [candidate division WOR-3 bacterium]
MMEAFKQLKELIKKKSAKVCVIGGGYVGLPIAVEFAKKGFKTVVFDIDAKKIEMINRGESYIEDVPSEELSPLVKSGKLEGMNDKGVISTSNVIIITVPTPLNERHEPDLSYINRAFNDIADYMQPPVLISLESTTYPGNTEEMGDFLRGRGYKYGEDFFLGFSPERINPGDRVWKFHNTPKIVGGLDPLSTQLLVELYSTVVEKVVPVSNSRTAELTKLLENTFRAVNIALVNEFAIISHKLNVDVWEVIEAAGTKPFGFVKFYPGPGVGGHCIPIDPLYLLWKVRQLGINAEFIELADKVNRYMPRFVVSLLEEALSQGGRVLAGERVLIVGIAYKKNISDTRESPAIEIIKILREKGAEVSYHDPYVPRFGEMKSKGLKEGLEWTDIVVITTDHDNIDYNLIGEKAEIIVDTRNVMRRKGINPIGRLVVL